MRRRSPSPARSPVRPVTETAAPRAPPPRSVPTATAPVPSVSSGGAGPSPSPPPPPVPGVRARDASSIPPVTIPAGIDNGQAISLRGQGGAGVNGGPAGDLLISVTVRPSDKFRREGTAVYYDQPVSFAQAALGAKLTIPTIDGNVEYTMPRGTQPGTTFRLRGKGFPSVNGRGRGDQFVTIQVKVPSSLNREQREALEAFAQAMGEDNADIGKGFFDKRRKKK